MDTKKPDIATRDELDRLIADRDNDHDRLTYEHPKPSWVDDPDDTDRIHIRMRERRINHLENRLGSASHDLRHDFENEQEME
jgi:hypothetical protein